MAFTQPEKHEMLMRGSTLPVWMYFALTGQAYLAAAWHKATEKI